MTQEQRIEYFMSEIARLSNQVVDLQDERDALAAQVEALKLIVAAHERELPNLLNKSNEDKLYLPLSVAMNTIVDAQELRQKEITKIRAEAGWVGFVRGYESFSLSHEPNDKLILADQYADSIRQDEVK